ncbi:MAG: RNHCP domain-containing protein [Myxococcales bacterium]|nr:RNHCP domain-containing protein [Myxococcales bacterium]
MRTNPIARDEAFRCQHCDRDVPVGGRRPRDHCPWCLHSLHVDIVPGDRAAGCGGLLVPSGVEPSAKGLDILYRCDRCGAARKNRVLDDLTVPDDPAAVRGLVARVP